jgi:hypothetical protein
MAKIYIMAGHLSKQLFYNLFTGWKGRNASACDSSFTAQRFQHGQKQDLQIKHQ